MVDALWIATSAVEYWLSEMQPRDSMDVTFWIAAHPCDDQPYVADLRVWCPSALIDGEPTVSVT